MNTEMELKRACSRALKIAIHASFALLAAGGLQAANLWTNAVAIGGGVIGDNRFDSGSYTIFDNFNIPNGSKSWVVSAIDFTDFVMNVSPGDYKSTSWSLWAGDPLSAGTLVASGSGAASLTTLSGTCGAGVNNVNCVQTFTVTLANSVTLPSNQTYFLGTSNILVPSNGSESTRRAFSAGGNTAPGGSANGLQRWEQSNGSTTGVVNSTWTAGSENYKFPSDLNIFEGATAFDIQGALAPEPGTITLLTMAFAGCWFYLRRRTA